MSAEDILSNVLLDLELDRQEINVIASDFETRQIVGFMSRSGKEIATKGEWTRMYKEAVLSFGTDFKAILPSDFREMAEKGAVRLTSATYTPFRPVIEPEQWQFIKTRPSAQDYYHLSGGKLEVSGPGIVTFVSGVSVETVTVPYVSKYWLDDDKAKFDDNSNTVRVPEYLIEKGAIWRWKRNKGLPYDDIAAEYEADILNALTADRGAG